MRLMCTTVVYHRDRQKSLKFQNPRKLSGFGCGMAEREGFEPPMELPPCRISSAVQSTTLPPLREVEPTLPRLVETGGLMA